MPVLGVASMQRRAARFMTDVCVIQKSTSTRNADGDMVPIWVDGVPVACRVAVSALSPREGITAGQVTANINQVVYLPAGTDVDARDRIAVAGRVLEVTSALYGTDEVVRKVVATVTGGV